MAETTADVRRDIELTRERMSSTLNGARAKAERRTSRSRQPVARAGPRGRRRRAAERIGAPISSRRRRRRGATKGTSNKLGAALDDVVATLLRGVHDAIDQRINGWVGAGKERTRRAGQNRSAGVEADWVDSHGQNQQKQPRDFTASNRRTGCPCQSVRSSVLIRSCFVVAFCTTTETPPNRRPSSHHRAPSRKFSRALLLGAVALTREPGLHHRVVANVARRLRRWITGE